MCPVLAFRSPVQLEQLPLILAVVVGLAGSALVVDAFLVDQSDAPATERRRRVRAERHRVGEALVGLGVLAAAAGLAGRDSWAYGTLTMMGGAVLLVIGAGLNHRLLGELLFHHGAARRQPVARTGSGAVLVAANVSDLDRGDAGTDARGGGGRVDQSPVADEDGERAREVDEVRNTVGDEPSAMDVEADRSRPLRIR